MLALVLVSSWAMLAQGQPQQQSGSSAAAGSQAGATAIIDQSGAQAPRQFVGAVPGVLYPGTFPVNPIPGSDYYGYCPAALRSLTTTQVDLMKRGAHAKVSTVAINPNPALPNNDAIQLVCYWPEVVANDGDSIIGYVYVEQKDDVRLAARYVALGLAEVKRMTGANRVAVRIKIDRLGRTKGMSIGTGGAAARITEPASGNDPIAIAAGGLLGVNTTRVIEHFIVEIACLNPGSPYTPRMPAAPPPAPPPPQRVIHEWASPLVVRAEGPLDVKVDWQNPLPVTIQAPTAPPVAPAPASQPQPVVADACTGLPPFVVLFDFDTPKPSVAEDQLFKFVKPEFIPKIKEVIQWLNEHSTCHVQVEGHTCHSGTFAYDAALGRRRAKAVYQQLISNGGKAEQIEQFVSLSKDRIAEEEEESPNRRVILRIIGPASGK